LVPPPTSLDGWLSHLERLHPKTIELGLERVARVKARLELMPEFPVIAVGGTNGKGSTCAILESILGAAGYRVGCYTSPHLLRYNERVRVEQHMVEDAALCESFEAVEMGRGETPLTYFEFGTLAAMWLFVRDEVDVAILEVGLGGRLDAVNVFDPAASVVTTVDIDHVDYLGPTRESIGFEKAGIFRSGRPAICGDANPPATLTEYAAEIQARLLCIGRDFGFEDRTGNWRFWHTDGVRDALPYPALMGSYQLANAAAAIMALETLQDRLPVAQNHIRKGLLDVRLPGRFQVVPGRPSVILDVAHNPAAARALAGHLARQPVSGKTWAVFAMLADKDIAGVIEPLKRKIDGWFVAPLPFPRGAPAGLLREALEKAGVHGCVAVCESVRQAYQGACLAAAQDDRILIFGSFYTVSAALAMLLPADGANHA
jgi:dihydrofolate synthase/folylpolyglutamate synthase